MDNRHVETETDGNPDTAFEDTQAHERTGFFVNEAAENEANPDQPSTPKD